MLGLRGDFLPVGEANALGGNLLAGLLSSLEVTGDYNKEQFREPLPKP